MIENDHRILSSRSIHWLSLPHWRRPPRTSYDRTSFAILSRCWPTGDGRSQSMDIPSICACQDIYCDDFPIRNPCLFQNGIAPLWTLTMFVLARLVLVTLFSAPSAVNALKGPVLSIEKISGELTVTEVRTIIHAALPYVENYVPLSRLMTSVDLGIPQHLAATCSSWTPDILANVLEFVSHHPALRTYWLPPICVSRLPAGLYVTDYTALTYSDLPMATAVSNLAHILATFRRIDELDEDGTYRWQGEWHLTFDWRLLMDTKYFYNLPVHRFLSISVVEAWLQSEINLATPLTTYLKDVWSRRDLAAVYGTLFHILNIQDEIKERVEGEESLQTTEAGQALTVAYLLFISDSCACIRLLLKHANREYPDVREQLLFILLNFIQEAIFHGQTERQVPRAALTVIEAETNPQIKMELVRLIALLARLGNDVAMLDELRDPLQHLALTASDYDLILLLESLLRTADPPATCAQLFSSHAAHRIMRIRSLWGTADVRLFGCLSAQQRIAYFRQWERSPLPDTTADTLIMPVGSESSEDELDPTEYPRNERPLSAHQTIHWLIHHYHSLPLRLPRRGDTLACLRRWFWRLYFTCRDFIQIEHVNHVRYVTIKSSPYIPDLYTKIRVKGVVAVLTLVRLHGEPPVLLDDQTAKAIICGTSRPHYLAAELHKSAELVGALSIAHNIVHCSSPNVIEL